MWRHTYHHCDVTHIITVTSHISLLYRRAHITVTSQYKYSLSILYVLDERLSAGSCTNSVPMLCQHLRRWPNIGTELDERYLCEVKHLFPPNSQWIKHLTIKHSWPDNGLLVLYGESCIEGPRKLSFSLLDLTMEIVETISIIWQKKSNLDSLDLTESFINLS